MDRFSIKVASSVGDWGVEGTEEELTRVYMPEEAFRVSRGTTPLNVQNAARQLLEYFDGTRRSFSLPLAPVDATAFQRDVWNALRQIPYGEVRTYGEIAASVDRPRAMRAVGNANHANPWPIIVPCHRVVALHGLGGYGGGLDVKRFLLQLEGLDYE